MTVEKCAQRRRIEQVLPSLEDVFVAMVEAQDRARVRAGVKKE